MGGRADRRKGGNQYILIRVAIRFGTEAKAKTDSGVPRAAGDRSALRPDRDRPRLLVRDHRERGGAAVAPDARDSVIIHEVRSHDRRVVVLTMMRSAVELVCVWLPSVVLKAL